MDRSEIERRFTYHPPKGDQVERYEEIREMARTFAHRLNELCPDSREKSLGFSQLQLAVMMFNASIACNE